jgi:uncharacterized protein involved in exopolysaccharide biosynthesis
MGLFTNTEKKIATAITGAFTKVESEVKQIEQVNLGDIKVSFEKAHSDAVAANKEVTDLKAALQDALTRATNLHQIAVDAAKAAQASAEADVARFKALADAHAADLITQQSQIIAPPAPAPVVATTSTDVPTSGTPA